MRITQLLVLASLLLAQAQSVSANGDKRKVAYWSIYDGEAVPGEANLSQLDGLTHLILFGVDMRTCPLAMASSSRRFPGDLLQQARAKDIKVMGAFGGWAQDHLFFTETDNIRGSKDKAIKLGQEIAALAIAEKWDGVRPVIDCDAHVTDLMLHRSILIMSTLIPPRQPIGRRWSKRSRRLHLKCCFPLPCLESLIIHREKTLWKMLCQATHQTSFKPLMNMWTFTTS